MPRYFFDVSDADGFHRDDIGDDFDTIDDAHAQCQKLLPDIARSELPDGDIHIIACTIRDENGTPLYRGQVTYQGIWVRPVEGSGFSR